MIFQLSSSWNRTAIMSPEAERLVSEEISSCVPWNSTGEAANSITNPQAVWGSTIGVLVSDDIRWFLLGFGEDPPNFHEPWYTIWFFNPGLTLLDILQIWVTFSLLIWQSWKIMDVSPVGHQLPVTFLLSDGVSSDSMSGKSNNPTGLSITPKRTSLTSLDSSGRKLCCGGSHARDEHRWTTFFWLLLGLGGLD